jgi:hypothetical protein
MKKTFEKKIVPDSNQENETGDLSETPANIPESERGSIDNNISLDDVAIHTAESSPSPNETAIGRIAENDKKNSEEEKFSGKGSGQKGKTRGKYVKIKDRPGYQSKIRDPRKEPTQEESQKAKDKECFESGRESITAIVMMTSGFLGPEWNWLPPREMQGPNNEIITWSEQEQGEKVIGDLFVYYGWGKPSPLLAVIAFAIGFVARRSQMPETKKKMESWKEKLAGWWAKRMVRKHAEKESKREIHSVKINPA